MIHTQVRNIKRIMLALCALFLSADALNAAPFVYVPNLASSSVSVIDVASNNVIDTILLTTSPQDGIAISPDGTTAYVPCIDGSKIATIQRIDTKNNTLLSPIELGSSIGVNYIAITPNGQFAYVTVSSPAEVLQINLTSNTVVGTVTGFSSPSQIVITANGLTAYVLDSPNVIPIDLATNTAQTAVTNLMDAQGLAVSPDSAFLYVSDTGTDSIQQYNITGSNRLTPVFERPIDYFFISSFTPTFLVISPNGNTLYVSSTGGAKAIGAIKISNPGVPSPSPTYLSLIGGAPFAMAITPDNNTLYATLQSANNTIAVNIMSPLAPTLTQTIAVGTTPAGLAITPSNFPPTNVSGCKTCNWFLFQTDFINNITWTAPASGTAPASYNIYRDAALTQLVTTIPASSTLQYYDHDRNPSITYTYYIVSVDSSGNQSTAASVMVTNPC